MSDFYKVIDALTRCGNNKSYDKRNCRGCPYNGFEGGIGCSMLLSDALELLKEQDERIKEKDETINNLIEQIKDLGD